MSFKIIKKNAVDLMSTKLGFTSVSASLIPTIVLSKNKLAFLPLQKDLAYIESVTKWLLLD